MLIVSCFMALMAGFGGWLGQLGYIVGMGYHNLTLLLAARSTQMFRRSSSGNDRHWLIKCFFTANANELSLMVYLVFFWIAVKITSLKSLSFDLGGGTFPYLMDGWNCTLTEFWAIYCLWLILSLLSVMSCLFLLTNDKSDNLYKLYLIKYKLSWDLITLAFITGYNFWAYQRSNSLMDCLLMFRDGGWARCIWYWGAPASTILFFFMKQGRFKEVSSDMTENQNDLEKELNSMEIDREFNQREVYRS